MQFEVRGHEMMVKIGPAVKKKHFSCLGVSVLLHVLHLVLELSDGVADLTHVRLYNHRNQLGAGLRFRLEITYSFS